MSTIEDLSLWYKARQDRVNAGADRLARRAWAGFDSADPQAWASSIPGMVRMVQAGKAASATGATDYVSRALRMQGGEPDPVGEVNPSAFAETAADGRPLGSLLYVPAVNVQARIDAGMPRSDAASAGLSDLLMIVGTEVADAGRQAVAAAMNAEFGIAGYYREPGNNACARCAILAGKWYRTYEGAAFERHPRCQCTAVPAASQASAKSAKFSPSNYFDSLSRARQDAVFTKAGAQAIRDGADMGQVVNARRGMSTVQTNVRGWIPSGRLARTDVYGQRLYTTTEGTTKRGLANKAGRSSKAPRLMPESIYEISTSREDAVRLLKAHGYLL